MDSGLNDLQLFLLLFHFPLRKVIPKRQDGGEWGKRGEVGKWSMIHERIRSLESMTNWPSMHLVVFGQHSPSSSSFFSSFSTNFCLDFSLVVMGALCSVKNPFPRKTARKSSNLLAFPSCFWSIYHQQFLQPPHTLCCSRYVKIVFLLERQEKERQDT